MIIKKLVLYNFGVYASRNEFIFNDEKPVVLIGGMNGRGKTTFLESILLALYGSNSFAVSESKYKQYSAYLKAHTNIDDGTTESYVLLEFEMTEDEKTNVYTVQRSWNLKNKTIKDAVSVQKNHIPDAFLTNNWAMFVESILPSALANFYFFDGEKIAELAEGETNQQMKNSIKALLGINIIDTLEADLSRIIKKFQSEESDNYDILRLEELKNTKEEKEKNLSILDDEIADIENELAKICKKLDKKREEFNAKGGHIAGESQALYSERGSLNSKLERIQEEYVDLASSELPLLMVKSLLTDINHKSGFERESRNMQMAVSKIDEIFQSYLEDKGVKTAELSGFMEYVKGKTEATNTPVVFDLSENANAQLMMLCNSQLSSARAEYLSNKAEEEKILKRVDEIDNYLSVDIDEKTIQKIYRRICELENQKTELEIQKDSKLKTRSNLNGELQAATTEFNRYVEKSLASMERKEDVSRMLSYAVLARKISGQYKIELQRAKIKNLAEIMTDCYKKLLGKKNLINNIEMDADTLDYKYVDINGNEVLKSSLSAGEKQLIVIAMLWALALCSNKKLPVIIDTPLASLDSFHRTMLIDRYFPNASSQTIILSTDSEIDSTYYKVIQKHVSNEFTLVYNEDLKQSHIESGYFKGVIG